MASSKDTKEASLLRYLARDLHAEWEELARYLSLSHEDIHKLKEDYLTVREATYYMLLLWKQRQGQSATYCDLARALQKVGRNDLENKVLRETNSYYKPFRPSRTQLVAGESLDKIQSTNKGGPMTTSWTNYGFLRTIHSLFQEMKLKLIHELSISDCKKVAKLADLPLATDTIKDGSTLLGALEQLDSFSKEDVSYLCTLFNKCDLHRAAAIVISYQTEYKMLRTQYTGIIFSDMKLKLIQVLTKRDLEAVKMQADLPHATPTITDGSTLLRRLEHLQKFSQEDVSYLATLFKICELDEAADIVKRYQTALNEAASLPSYLTKKHQEPKDEYARTQVKSIAGTKKTNTSELAGVGFGQSSSPKHQTKSTDKDSTVIPLVSQHSEDKHTIKQPGKLEEEQIHGGLEYSQAQNETVAEVSLDFGQHQITKVIDTEDVTYSDSQFFFRAGGSKSLEASSTISQEGGSIEIPETGVALQIQPNSFQREDEVQTITVRILQRRLYDEPARCFEDHTSVMVEILPNNFQLHRPAKLTLPHCLVIGNLENCQVQIFHSHHEEDRIPQWENITKSVRWELLETSCTIWIRNFSWMRCEIDGEGIEGKKLFVYTLGEKFASGSNNVTAEVGYFPALPGNDRVDLSNSMKGTVYESKLPEMFRGTWQLIVFRKEPRNPLLISISEIIPVGDWEASPGSACPKEISYQNIEMSIEQSRPFTFQRKTSDFSFPVVHFKVYQEEANSTEIYVNMEKGVIKEDSDVPSVDSPRALVGVMDQHLSRLTPVCSNIELGHTVSMLSTNDVTERLQVRQPHRVQTWPHEVEHLQSQLMTWHPLNTSMASLSTTDPPKTLQILKDLTCIEVIHIARCLNQDVPIGNDWRLLAGKLGFSFDEVTAFQAHRSPTEAVIRAACSSGKLASKSQLEKLLKEIGRKDAAVVLTCKAEAAESFGEEDT